MTEPRTVEAVNERAMRDRTVAAIMRAWGEGAPYWLAVDRVSEVVANAFQVERRHPASEVQRVRDYVQRVGTELANELHISRTPPPGI